MSNDFLEQLAQLDVPAPPSEFDQQLHQRVNQSLMVQQIIDLMVRGMPWAMLHLARALAGLGMFSMTGRYPEERTPKNGDSL